MSEIFLYRHDAGINPQQLQKLRREGYIPVGVSSIDSARLLAAPVQVSQARLDAIGRAALDEVAQCGIDWVGRNFAKRLAALLPAPPKEVP